MADKLEELRILAAIMAEPSLPNIDDDALIYRGSATWEQWENHVPLKVCDLWPQLSEEARLAVYVTAKAFTNYGFKNANAMTSKTSRSSMCGG